MTDAPKKTSVDDFEFGDTLGSGAYGAVVIATHKATQNQYAAKIIEQEHLKKEKKTKYAVTERKILSMCKHPNIIRIFFSFRDKEHLYYILELAPNGDLEGLLKKHGSLSLECTRFYAAEIISALEHLHVTQQVIHRDLKPDNILLSATNHCKLTDFGTGKIVSEETEADRGRPSSFVGTADYISPELLAGKSCTYSADLWALGCILYEMITGCPPFRANSVHLTMMKVQTGKFRFPTHFPEVLQDLISKLLVIDPEARLGASRFEDLKLHPFFEGVNWAKLHKTTPPEAKPWDGEKLELIEDDALEQEEEQERKAQENVETRKRWGKSLAEDEEILESGFLMKKIGDKFHKRFVLVTSKKKLYYLHPIRRDVKGVLDLSEKVVSFAKEDDCHLTLTLPTVTYYFEEPNQKADKWIAVFKTTFSTKKKKSKQ